MPGVLNLHLGNLPRGMTGEELQKALSVDVEGPVAVSKKTRDIFARVTVRDDEAARAAVTAAAEKLESKYPVRVSAWGK